MTSRSGHPACVHTGGRGDQRFQVAPWISGIPSLVLRESMGAGGICGPLTALGGRLRHHPVALGTRAKSLATADGAEAMFGAVERAPVEAGVATVTFAIPGELPSPAQVLAQPLLALATLGGLLGSGLLG